MAREVAGSRPGSAGRRTAPQAAPALEGRQAPAHDGANGAEPSELFSRISPGRVSEMIVEQIRVLIRQGKLRPGDRLPAERELCERFGVSRVTVREALRVLESSGLVQIRVGARGGAFVTAPSGMRVGEGFADLISLSALTPAEVTELRQVLELGIVPLVCERASAEDVAALREINARARAAARGGSSYSMELSAEFHVRVAQATHNAAITMLVESIRGPLIVSLETAQHRAPQMGKLGVEEHDAFVDAVADGDCERASAVMRRHLWRTAARIRS